MRVPALALVVAIGLVGPGCGWIRRHRAPAAPPAPAVIDLNSASLRKVSRLPGITPTMAQRIVDGRPYADPHDLVTRGILTEREFDRISDRIRVKAHR